MRHNKDNLPQIEESAEDKQIFSNTDKITYLEKITQKPQIGQGQQRQKRPSQATLRIALMVGDGILLIALLILAPVLHKGLKVPGSIWGTWNTSFVWISLVLVLWSIAASVTRAQHLNRAADLLKGPLYGVSALILMFFFCIFFLYIFIGNKFFSYTNILLFSLITAVPTFYVWRIAVAKTLSLPHLRRQAVIVGISAAREIIARELVSTKHLTLNILGYISENLDSRSTETGLPILGDKMELRHLARNGMVDMIIMALDYKANQELFKEAFEASQLGISVVPMAVIYESTSGKIPLEHIGDQWYVALQTERIASPLYLCWRKIIDLIFGLGGLLALCLVLPILSLLIYLDSPGPIFFTQERVGYQGRVFRIFKFRSMSTDAGHIKNAAWVSKGDARVTRVGRILRATHLDELPQVLNILRGDMSLIGPRPERPEFVAELEKENSLYGYRLSVRPGLTGWAQVNCGYGSTKQDELIKLQYDLYYIKYQSSLFDVFILLKTVMEVAFCHGV